MKTTTYISVICLWLTCNGTWADIKISPLFASDMVIQRDTQAPIWGWAEPGEEVTVTASWGASESVAADEDGAWRVFLATPPAGGPHSLKIKGNKEIVLTNILSGDVWFCSGQSNMEWKLKDTTGAGEEIDNADYPEIRHAFVHRQTTLQPTNHVRVTWSICSPATAGRFTAVGYYFARAIHGAEKVPVGIINASWGGSRIEPFTPLEGFETVPELQHIALDIKESIPTTPEGNAAHRRYLDELKAWIPRAEQALAESEILPDMPKSPTSDGGNQEPTVKYNGMIAPVVPFAITGAIWYQGESNGGEARELYRNKMRALIEGWRSVWGIGDIPFYFVQLANINKSNPDNPAGGDGWARVRQGQLDALAITNAGMAVGIDIGETNDIHPRNKRDVGLRLARWALARHYGRNIVYSGPLFKDMRVDGTRAILSFEHVGSGLMVGDKNGMDPVREMKGGVMKWFAVQGENGHWHWGDAVIEGNTIVVTSSLVETPLAVRYAYTANPEGPKLYNREGLPASPFTTEPPSS